MHLKDMLKEDIKGVFLECNDFAETHIVEGKPILVVEDKDTLQELKNGAENELAEAELLFYAAVDDLPHRRGYGSMLSYDGIDYFVISWDENYDMATVVLKKNGGSYGDFN